MAIYSEQFRPLSDEEYAKFKTEFIQEAVTNGERVILMHTYTLGMEDLYVVFSVPNIITKDELKAGGINFSSNTVHFTHENQETERKFHIIDEAKHLEEMKHLIAALAD